MNHPQLWSSGFLLMGSIATLSALAWGLIRHRPRMTAGGLAAFVAICLLAVPLLLVTARAEHADGIPTAEVLTRQGDATAAAIVGLLAAGGVGLAALVIWRSSRRMPRFAATAAVILGLGASVLIARCLVLGLSCERDLATHSPVVAQQTWFGGHGPDLYLIPCRPAITS